MFQGEFKEDYRAELKCINKHLSKEFGEVVTWCIKADIENLQEIIKSESNSIYKQIIFSNLKDKYSNLNLREIVATTGKTEVMKAIHVDHSQEGPGRHLFLGKALEIAIAKEDLNMVKCILSRNYPKINNIFEYLKSVYDPEKIKLFGEIANYASRTEGKYRSSFVPEYFTIICFFSFLHATSI